MMDPIPPAMLFCVFLTRNPIRDSIPSYNYYCVVGIRRNGFGYRTACTHLLPDFYGTDLINKLPNWWDENPWIWLLSIYILIKQ
jgi:hypothetical protein